jgi:hypothetical protein
MHRPKLDQIDDGRRQIGQRRAFRIGAYVRLGVDDTERSQVKSIRGPQGPFGPIIPLRRGTILVP